MRKLYIVSLVVSLLFVAIRSVISGDCINSEPSCTCESSTSITCTTPNVRLNLKEIVSEMNKKKQNFTSVKFELSNIPVIQNVSFSGLTIDTLSLKYNRIQQIYPQVFVGFTDCKTIYLRFNFLTEPVQLSSSKLESLNLGWNLLTKLERKTFSNITNLRTLDLAHNKISRINSDAFTDLKSLQSLSIFNNLIKQIADYGFSYLGVLNDLNIGLNYLDEIKPSYFVGLSYVSTFLINCNYLSYLNSNSMKSLTSLRSLNFSYQGVKSLSRSDLKGMPNIEWINASSNLIAGIDNYTFIDLPSLRYVDFSINMIKEPCSLVQNMSHLSILYLNLVYNLITDMSPFCFRSQTKLIELYLDYNTITVLRESVFKGLESSLQYLSISHNKIQFIKKYNFAGMASLRELILSYNQISSIGSGSFSSLINLTSLTLDNNCIYSLDSNTWDGLVSLNYLRLDSNVLRSVSFLNTTKIKYLDLSRNYLESFSINRLSNSLETLNISNNPYLRVFVSSRNITSLKNLNMSQSNITQASLQKFPALESLDLSYSSPYTAKALLNSLPQKPTQFIELDLSYCTGLDVLSSIRNLAIEVQFKVKKLNLRSSNILLFSLKAFTALVSLDISEVSLPKDAFIQTAAFVKAVYPKIQVLYLEMIGFNESDSLNLQLATSLTELYLGWNKFDYVTKAHFKSSTKLKVLFLNNMGLKYIENGTFSSLVRLISLDVSNNFLKYLEPFYNLLENLNVRNNSLVEMFNTELHEVNDLDFSNNQLTELPPIRSLALKYLNMGGNKISYLSNNTFLFFCFLRNLYLNQNQIQIIDSNTFKKLHYLEKLDLSGNGISQLDETIFSGLTNLIHLNLSNNSIEWIQNSVFDYLIAVIELDLSYNQLKLIEDSSFVNLYSLAYFYLNENSDLRQISNHTFEDLQEQIVLIEIDHSLVEQVSNFKLLFDSFNEKPSDRKITVDSQPDLDVLFYYSIDIVFYTDTSYTACECKQILKYVRHNKKLSLYTDSLVDKFLSDCQTFFNLLVRTGIDKVDLIIDSDYCFN